MFWKGCFRQAPLSNGDQRPITELGRPVKLKFVVFLAFLGLAAICAADSADVKPSSTDKVLTTTELVAWLAGGVPNSRLVRLVGESGLTAAPGKDELRQLQSAGADQNLLRVLASVPTDSIKTSAQTASAPIPPALLKAAAAAAQQNYHEAELQLREALRGDPQSSALHFALSAMLRQQDQWDDAFDEITLSLQLKPNFPENHSSLSYIFYRLDDGPNAVAEARTALSMDPENSEAYQYLGLGFYSSGEYGPAVHAFAQSLLRDPENADSYYDMGIALHAAGKLPAALAAYERAIGLRPDFWEAHSNLALTLHEEGKLDQAVVEYRAAKKLAPEEASVRNNLGNTYCAQGEERLRECGRRTAAGVAAESFGCHRTPRSGSSPYAGWQTGRGAARISPVGFPQP